MNPFMPLSCDRFCIVVRTASWIALMTSPSLNPRKESALLMLTKVVDSVVPSPVVLTILLTGLPSMETRARTWLVAIFSLKPMLKEPGV